jgi:hypothetical protein
MGGCEVLFFQIQTHLITNIKLVWNPMLVMSLLVLSISFLEDIMNLLLDVFDPFNKIGFFVCLTLRMGELFL